MLLAVLLVVPEIVRVFLQATVRSSWDVLLRVDLRAAHPGLGIRPNCNEKRKEISGDAHRWGELHKIGDDRGALN